MARSASPRPPGRPKNDAKRAAIIAAARRLFAANAYEAVTMEQVASGAGVAKMTVYSHFRDKETMFEAVVRSTSDSLVAALPAMPRSDGDMAAELDAFGQAFLRVLFGSGVLSAMHRHAEMLRRNPDLAARVYDAGPGRTRATLAAYLAAAGIFARCPAEQARDAASDLINLWVGDMPMRFGLGLAAAPTEPDITRHVSRCTRLFLRAYRPPSS